MATIRRTIECEACGGPVGLYEDTCPYCGSSLTPLSEIKHRLPSVKSHPHAANDATMLKPFIDQCLMFQIVYPSEIDELWKILDQIRDHNYPFREYILDLTSLVSHFRSVCLKNGQARRDTHLEVLKRLEALYASFTT